MWISCQYLLAIPKKNGKYFFIVKILFNIVQGLCLLTHPLYSPAAHNLAGLFLHTHETLCQCSFPDTIFF